MGAVFRLATDNGFVGFDNLASAAQRRAASLVRLVIRHCLADTMA